LYAQSNPQQITNKHLTQIRERLIWQQAIPT
jgi:hypothetical protein